jgi:dTDP-4-dehydrorhamnose 3,5-epimerase
MTMESGRFCVDPLPLKDLQLLTRKPSTDERGCLERVYDQLDFSTMGIDHPIAQINRTITRNAGVVRGMHFQHAPYAEAKLVTCIRGEIFDVALDLRGGSKTFLRWHAEILSASNHRSLYIPEGFAHGFQTLCDDCELLYLHSAAYVPTAEGCISPLDIRIGIAWPRLIVSMSPRDSEAPSLPDDFRGVLY